MTTNQIRDGSHIMRNHIQRTQNAVIELRTLFDQLKPYLESANNTAIQMDNQQSQSTQNSSNDASIQTPEDILKRINEIQIKAEINSTQNEAKMIWIIC